MNKLNITKFSEYAFLAIPIALITGPLISEMCIFVVAIFELYYSFKNKNFKIYKKNIILALFVFYIILYTFV